MKRIIAIMLCIALGKATYPATPSAQTAADTMHSYWWASYKEHGGNYQEANSWYTHLMNSNPPHHVNKGYIAFLSSTGQAAKIVSLIPSLDALFADDVDVQLTFALALQKIGKTEEADNRFIQLSNKFKQDQSIAFQAANVYLKRHELENALVTIDNVLNSSPKKPNNFVFHFLKAQIYMQSGQHEKALACVKDSLAIHPQFDKGILLQALLQEQAGRIQEAMHGFTHYLEITGNQDMAIKQHLLQLTFKQKIMQEHLNKTMINKTPFEKALYFFEQKDYAQALANIDTALRQTQDIESKLLKIQILSALNHFTQAADQLKVWILNDPNNNALFDALHLLCRMNNISYQKAINALEDIVRHQPKNLLALLHLADLNTRAHTYELALMYHTKALELTKDADLQTKILFTMGMIYHEQNNSESLEKVLERGLALGKNFPPLLNLLAYHYATHNKKLAQAQRLINLALQKNKNNPHFLDTQALIFYAQKEYSKALALLESLPPHKDSAILRNLGTIHYQLGNKKKAAETMEKALQLAQRDDEKKLCTSWLCKWGIKTP